MSAQQAGARAAVTVGIAVGSYDALLDYDLSGTYHFSLLVNGFAAAAIVQAVRVRPFTPIAPPPSAPVGAPTLGAG